MWCSKGGATGSSAELAKVIGQLGPAQQRAFLSLSQAPMHGAGKSVAGTWLTNALPIEDEAKMGNNREVAAIFVTISRFNHACAPSCHREWNPRLGKMTVHAQRTIARGEELTISYLSPAGRTRSERQALLSRQFGFACGCGKCSLVGKDLTRSDVRQGLIGDIDGLAQQLGEDGGGELLQRADQRARLIEEEGLPSVWARPLLFAAMAVATSHGGESTHKWAARAIECVRHATGTDHPSYDLAAQFSALAEMRLDGVVRTLQGLQEQAGRRKLGAVASPSQGIAGDKKKGSRKR